MNALPVTQRDQARPYQILVVDDHSIFTDSLSALLRLKLGAEVKTCKSPADALAHWQQTEPDLILLGVS